MFSPERENYHYKIITRKKKEEDKMFSPEREAKRELCHRLDLPRLETSGC